MRILLITPYITSTSHPVFLRNQTGFGYMVHDIAQYVAKIEDIDVFAPMAFTPSMEVDGFKVIGRSKWQLLKNLQLRNLLDGLAFNRKYRQPFKSRLRSLYIFASIGQMERVMKHYDIVHIHGCSELTDAVIKACQRQQVPFLVTLHGLNSFEQAIKQNKSMCQYERDFLKDAATNHYPVSFISTGNKNTAEASTGMKADSYCVICNGCDVRRKPMIENIRKEYVLSANDFVFSFVGNVSVNKNQIQVARAWKLLPNELRQRCKVLFVGRYKKEDELVQFIRNNHIESNLILCGIQPKERVSDFYHACNSTILTSITEGFGLSIIEGFVYGKPNVTFADLPATSDLYDENVMVLAKDRSDESLADAMERVMQTSFDHDYICNNSLRFSFERMAERYYELYRNVVK